MKKSRGLLAVKLGHSEFGGGAGLRQPAIAPDGGTGHSPTPSEVNNSITRLALGEPLDGDAETVAEA